MNDCWWISLLNKYAVKILLCRYSWKAPCPCTVDNFSKSWVQDSRGHHRHMQHNQRLREFHWYRSLGWGTCSSLAKPLDDVEIDFLNYFSLFFYLQPPQHTRESDPNHIRVWSALHILVDCEYSRHWPGSAQLQLNTTEIFFYQWSDVYLPITNKVKQIRKTLDILEFCTWIFYEYRQCWRYLNISQYHLLSANNPTYWATVFWKGSTNFKACF